ncbi:MAG TPA: ACT domain-containing protein [Burkholderiales bacterium]|nr:ACT domain-containing protein [Burkholderiales bacterium]
MAIKASRNDVWMTVIDDRAGGAAEKLEALAKAGADLEVVFARRTPEHPGQGILFAGPIEGARVTRAAQEAGFKRSDNIHGVRIEGIDKPGLGAKIARTLADAGINFRGMQAQVIGKNFLSFVACDNPDDAAKAVKALRKL